jgi:hypothetical protein
MSAATSPVSVRLPFELADLRLLNPGDAEATLKRFEWLRDFAMHAPGAATPDEGRLLLQAIELLQEVQR